MADNADIKRRVERLLTDRWDVRDLDRIYSWLRFKSFGHNVVRDIGDFTAHLEDRNKGVAWKHAQNLNATLVYHIPRIEARGRAPTPVADVETLREAMKAALELDDPAKVREVVGLGKDKARAALAEVLSKITSFDGTTVHTSGQTSAEGQKVFGHYSRMLILTASISDAEIAVQTFEALLRNKLVGPSDRDAFLALSPVLAMFALEKMHLTKLLLPKGRWALAKAGVDENGKLAVFAEMPIDYSGKTLRVLTGLLKTDSNAADWCWPELPGNRAWDQPLEIVDRKLRFLVS